MHTALASSLASIILTGASSARAHNARGSVRWPTVAWMVPGLLLGGWLGSWFAVAVRGEVLRWCVALYCFVVAAQMAFGGPRGGAAQDAVVPTGWPMAAAGADRRSRPWSAPAQGDRVLLSGAACSRCARWHAVGLRRVHRSRAAGWRVCAGRRAAGARGGYVPAGGDRRAGPVLAAPLARLAHAISGNNGA